jgi:hypothetical protein
MGSRASDRLPRLADIRQTPRDQVRMAVCQACQHMAPLPVRELIRRYGDSCPVEMALIHLRCEECRQSNVEARLVPLCEPGCRRWR